MTACPLDMSTTKMQIGIKNNSLAKAGEPTLPVQAAYRFIVEPNEAYLKLAIQRARMLKASVAMGPDGMPATEYTPGRDHFPCDFCAWKSYCISKGTMGLSFPAIPDSMKIKPVAFR